RHLRFSGSSPILVHGLPVTDGQKVLDHFGAATSGSSVLICGAPISVLPQHSNNCSCSVFHRCPPVER
ncbi:hypothetical protein HAX54_019243, partial [Datura stramonium]|nr:hypothetical protein [Datura stramonium]